MIELCWFESFVNSERCKTNSMFDTNYSGLRALLIQKDVKPFWGEEYAAFV